MPSATKLQIELDKLSVSIDSQAKKAYKRLIGLLDAGHSPREALDAVYLSFTKGSFNHGYLEALSTAFTVLLQKPFTPVEMMTYQVGKISLSSKIYSNSKIVAEGVTKVLTEHAAVFQNLRKLGLDIFSGYNQKSIEVLKVKKVLPEYLLNAVSPYASDLDKEFAKIAAQNLATPALRAAYSTALDKIEKGVGEKARQKALQVAAWEKQRYLANRIAQTETARAYSKKAATDLKAKEHVAYVQVRPAGSHKPDLCDMFIKPDYCGKGAGVYPKSEAPIPPYHPHCRCRLVGLVNEKQDDKAEFNILKQEEYYNSLSEEEQKQILTNKSMRRNFAQGMDMRGILNDRNGAEYQIKTIGDLPD